MSIDLKKRFLTSIILLSLFFFIFKFKIILISSLLILGILSLIEFNIVLNKILNKKILLLVLNTFFAVYVFLISYIIIFFYSFFQLKIILFVILLGCIASDVGGYAVGKIFKGPKLTKISPNKTISGAVGSLLFTSAVINGFFYYLSGIVSLKIFSIGIITSFTCQAGDLFFSYLKRKAKIKHMSNFLPGHGGILDRIDGILLGLPIGFISFIKIY